MSVSSLPLSAQIEALLFMRTEPVSISRLGQYLDTSSNDIEQGLSELEEKLNGRGLLLVRQNNQVMLATHPDVSNLLESATRTERALELSRNALETLSIVLYRSKTTKAEIDYIRGVNSQAMLRNLMMRGLIAREVNPDDKRRPWYIATHNTLRYFGIATEKELPGYVRIQEAFAPMLANTEEVTSATEGNNDDIDETVTEDPDEQEEKTFGK